MSKLLQELAHPAKLKILRAMTVQPESAEQIAQQFGMSVKETSVHLDRLHSVGLVDRKSDGVFNVSPLGQLILLLLEDLDFVESHLEYFRDHELSLLPPAFIARLGELKEGERTDGTVVNIQSAERVFSRSEKRISVIANEVMLDAVPVVRDKISKGADFRFVIDQSFKPPPTFKPTQPELWRQVWKIPVATVVTDKEAMLFFLDRELKVDYSVGFASKDPTFMKWCKDLLDSLWNQGQKLK